MRHYKKCNGGIEERLKAKVDDILLKISAKLFDSGIELDIEFRTKLATAYVETGRRYPRDGEMNVLKAVCKPEKERARPV